MYNSPDILKDKFGKTTQQFAFQDPNKVDVSKSTLSNTQAMKELNAFEQGKSFDADLQSNENDSQPQIQSIQPFLAGQNNQQHIKLNLPSNEEEQYNNKKQKENFLLSYRRSHDFMDMNETNQVLMFETINELILELDKQISLMQSYMGSLHSLTPIDESINTMLQLLQQIRSLEDKAIKNTNIKIKFGQTIKFSVETHQLQYPMINPNNQNSNQILFKIKEAQLQKYDKQTVIFRLRDSIDDKQVIGKTVLKKDIPKLNLLADDKSEGKYSIEFDLSKMIGTNASVNINWEQLYPVNKIKNLNAGQSQSNDAQQINQFSVDLLQKKTKDSYEVIATGTFDLNQLIGSDSCILEVLLQDSTEQSSDEILESSFLPFVPLSVKVELQIAYPLSGFKIQDNNLNFIIVQNVNEELIDILNRMKEQIFKLNQFQKVSIAHPSQQSIIQPIPNLIQPKQQQQQQSTLEPQPKAKQSPNIHTRPKSPLKSQQQTFAVPPKISKSSNSGQQNQQQNPPQQITSLNPPPPLTRLTRNRSLSPQGASSDQNKTADSVPVSSLNSSVPAPPQINSQEKDKLTQKELNTTQGLNSTQNGQLKTSGVQPKSMPKPPQPDQIQSQSDPNEFDPLVCQSEFEFEGQDFAEIEKVIPIDKLYPSNVLYREIDAVDKVKYLISRDKNNANKYENVQLLDARRAQADALANV
ncbi:MAG: hypothetical protein EZS28_028425 [Streblomastix strix]|uniref:Uncharacterized protein n=1 Tax=Streblomastix strix TaxID=222440 RepID=A0A5J4V015_9EUKA|nr:MAG: hypothetical protein EZS28_028425 [Streblomastix strix]